jgi:hypothetical protein
VCWDGLWKLSFGLSQFRGHGSWLVCEVALKTGSDGHKESNFIEWVTIKLVHIKS